MIFGGSSPSVSCVRVCHLPPDVWYLHGHLPRKRKKKEDSSQQPNSLAVGLTVSVSQGVPALRAISTGAPTVEFLVAGFVEPHGVGGLD